MSYVEIMKEQIKLVWEKRRESTREIDQEWWSRILRDLYDDLKSYTINSTWIRPKPYPIAPSWDMSEFLRRLGFGE